jgi:hypothetical protein
MRYVVIKYPQFQERFVTGEESSDEDYRDYVKIFIVRNPAYVYSSLNRRFNYSIPEDTHGLGRYIRTLERFKAYSAEPPPGMHFIRYEDMFQNNFDGGANEP